MPVEHDGQAVRFSVGDSMRFFAELTRASFATAVEADWTLVEPKGGTLIAEVSSLNQMVFKIGL